MKLFELLKSIGLMFVIVAVTVGSSVALNLHTAPIIAENTAGAALRELAAVLPGAKNFKEITAELTIDPASGVTAVYEEVNGLGFVFKASKAGYTSPRTVDAVVGVTADGKVAGLTVNTNGDYEVKEPAINSYIGQDSTLGDVVHTTGATTSSKALREAVSAGLVVLAANEKITAGKKTADQVFDELLLTVYPGFIIGKKSVLETSGNITKALKSNNNAGIVCHVSKGEELLLATYNIDGETLVYKAEEVDPKTQTYRLTDVTADNADVVNEVKTFSNGRLKSKDSDLATRIGQLFAGSTDVEKIQITTFGDVVASASFTFEEATYYAFYTRPNNAYDNKAMDIFVFLDSEGKILKIDIKEIFLEPGYFADSYPEIATFDVTAYKNKFVGLGSDSVTDAAFEKGGDLHISSATRSTYGVRDALRCAYALYEKHLGGNN